MPEPTEGRPDPRTRFPGPDQPGQQVAHPGRTSELEPSPDHGEDSYRGSGKLAFSMDNVDRDKMIYRCNRQVVKIGSQLKFKLPKGHKERDVPLGQGVLEQLDAYAEDYRPVKVTLPWGEQDSREEETVNLPLTGTASRPYASNKFNHTIWVPAFERAGLEYHRDNTGGMHALRHLVASSMLQQGVSIKELAAFLGHVDEAFTLRTYVHLMPNSFGQARLAVDAIFKPSVQPTMSAS